MNTTTELKLLPCPFCGGPVNLEKAHATRDRIHGERQWWGVVCRNTTNLGGTCCIEQVPSASPEAAIERWNRRTAAHGEPSEQTKIHWLELEVANLRKQLASLQAGSAEQVSEREFAEWLNSVRGADVSSVFHEIIVRYRAALQHTAPAPSIEYTPGDWFEARTIDEMQAFYMSRLPAIREAAKKHGYAIGLHGSTRRDFDLMAMQWRDDVSDKDALAHAIAVAACGITHDGEYQWEQKPNGRFAVSIPICWTDHTNNLDFQNKLGVGHIDLSIIDHATNSGEQAAPSRAGEWNAAIEAAAKVCSDEYAYRERAGRLHPEGSPERDRCFAAARAANNCEIGIRALSAPAQTSDDGGGGGVGYISPVNLTNLGKGWSDCATIYRRSGPMDDPEATLPVYARSQSSTAEMTNAQILQIAVDVGLKVRTGQGALRFARALLAAAPQEEKQAMPDGWEPKFEAIAHEQEQLAIKFCNEIAGKRGEEHSLPDPVRLLEMAEALYLAERNDSVVGIAAEQCASRLDKVLSDIGATQSEKGGE